MVIMAASPKLFQFFQKCHQALGISASQSNQKRYSIIWRRAIFFTITVQYCVTVIAYLVIEAKLMFDYGLGIFVLISAINTVIVYLIFVWQRENTLKFIENCEEFIAKSEYH